MNILVTGATGFIGRHLVGRLTGEGHHVKALVRQGTEAGWLGSSGAEIVRGDLRNPSAVEHAVSNCSLIYHLAARTESLGLLSRNEVRTTNVQGTEHIVRAAVQNGVDRLVFCSSVAVYGRIAKDRMLDESTATDPDSPYGESKVLGEQVVLSARHDRGLPVVIARISTVWGPGNASWLGLFQSIASGRFRVFGNGTNRHHIADVSDVVEGLLLCGTASKAEGRTYILAGRESVPLKDLIRMIGEEVGRASSPPTLPAWPLHLYRYLDRLAVAWTGRKLPRADRLAIFLGDRTFDISRACGELGYVPRCSLRDTVHRMAEWFRVQDALPQAK